MDKYQVPDIGSDSQRWNRSSFPEQKENSIQYSAYPAQQPQFSFIQAQTPQIPSHLGFSQTQQQPLSYRVNTDTSKSPYREKTSLSRSQSGGNYQPLLETYYLLGWGNSKNSQLLSSKTAGNIIQQYFSRLNIYLTHLFERMFDNKVISVSAGESHTMIIDYKQELYACGSNQYGQLGIENVSYLNKPTLIPALKDIKVSLVSCGADYTFALTTQGEVYAWGLNLKGQLGIGNFENQFSPVLVYSLLPFGSFNKKSKKKGTGETENEQSSMQKRIKSQSELRGDNSNSGLQERSNSIENMLEQLNIIKQESRQAKSISSAGASNAQAGNSVFGSSDILTQVQLGSEEVVTSISCGSLHTIVLTSKNRLLSAGFGETYALGHGDTLTQNSFKPIQTLQLDKRNSNKASPRIEKIEKIICGLSHSVCIIGGRAFIWGKCGQRDSLTYQFPKELNFQYGQSAQSISPSILDVKGGDGFSIFLNSKGDIFALGENTEGQLCSDNVTPYEYPMRINNIAGANQIAAGKNYCLAVSHDMKYIFGWGSNTFGQVTGRLTNNPLLSSPVKVMQINPDVRDIKIICGSYHTLMLSNKSLTGMEFIMKEDENQLLARNQQEEGGEDNNLELEKVKRQSQIESNKFAKLVEEKSSEIEALKKCNISLIKSQERNMKELKDCKIREQELRKQVKEINQKSESILQLAANNRENAIALGKSQQALSPLPNEQKFQIKGVDKFKNVNFRVFNSTLDIDYNELILEAKISEGGYGIIHLAKWRETTVAVKKFKNVNDENAAKEFLSECNAMEALRHPNIVMFLGACTKSPNFCIILEFCSKGSLWSLLQSDIKLTWEDRRRISLDTARGVHYLHSSNPPILHRDLKSLNLLLDDNFRCKLADFGWTRVISQDNYMTAKIGTYQWMAPEVISSNYYTEKADVFSFGIILWEIASREAPYKNKKGVDVSIEVVQNRLRPTIPKTCPLGFADLMQKCWETDPNLRPTFKEIIKELEKMTFSKTM